MTQQSVILPRVGRDVRTIGGTGLLSRGEPPQGEPGQTQPLDQSGTEGN